VAGVEKLREIERFSAANLGKKGRGLKLERATGLK